MATIAVLAPPFTSHVRALAALADALIARGHDLHWVAQTDVQAVLASARVTFHPVGAASHPAGSLAAVVRRAANPGGPLGLRRVIADVAAATDMLCADAPAVLRRIGCDGVIADQMEAAGGLVAEHLGVPCISVACALPVNREARIPLPVMHWGYAQDDVGLQMNVGSTRVYDWLMRPHAAVIARWAAAWGLPPRSRLDECLSPRVQIAQTVPGFDFPRDAADLRTCGPLRPPAAAEPSLALPGDDPARPFVFASLGTLQGGRFGLFRRIAQACRAAGVQLLLAHCDQLDARQDAALERAGATWVTGFAPQRAAIARADAVITHGGLNTVMDAIAAAKPMLVLPIAFDQPGCAARVVHAGCGLRLLPPLATAGAIRRALERLLREPQFAIAARALAPQVQQAGGVERAVAWVESQLQPIAEPA